MTEASTDCDDVTTFNKIELLVNSEVVERSGRRREWVEVLNSNDKCTFAMVEESLTLDLHR